jgi:hypothetical protein
LATRRGGCIIALLLAKFTATERRNRRLMAFIYLPYGSGVAAYAKPAVKIGNGVSDKSSSDPFIRRNTTRWVNSVSASSSIPR